MAKVVIDSAGIKKYYDSVGYLHREDGPAYITPSGTKAWRDHGMTKREWITETWQSNGIHKIVGTRYGDRPSYDYPNGFKLWFYCGKPVWPTL